MLARISNSILAHDQRRLFDKLLAQNVSFFADRHSSDFAARITFAAGAASQALNLIVNTLGPISCRLSRHHRHGEAVAAVVAHRLRGHAAAVLTVHKLVKRVRAITRANTAARRHPQNDPETIQGFKVIKAFNLEDMARRQIYQSVGEVERASNELARVSNRSTPLMESSAARHRLVFLYGAITCWCSAARRRLRVLHQRVPARLRAGEAHRRLTSSCTTRSPACRSCSTSLTRPIRRRANRDATEDRARPIAFGRMSFIIARRAVLDAMSFDAEPGAVTAFSVRPAAARPRSSILCSRSLRRSAARSSSTARTMRTCRRIRSAATSLCGTGRFPVPRLDPLQHRLGRPGATDAEISAAAVRRLRRNSFRHFPPATTPWWASTARNSPAAAQAHRHRAR